MKTNPPWANRLLRDNWDEILDEVKNPQWMPKPVEATKKRQFTELGCGHYGCVFETRTPGIVFKISTDPSEIDFVKAAMQLGEWPPGIVRYHAVLEVEGTHRNRQAFVLWREEAFDVGKIKPGADSYEQQLAKEVDQYRRAYRFAATYVRDTSLKPTWQKRLDEAKRLEQWAFQNVIWEDGLPAERYGMYPPFTRMSTNHRLAAALRICEIAFELMEHTNWMPAVGRALAFYLEHGILLADVHINNVGRVKRDDGELVVITDPGHAVFLGARP